MQPGTKETVGQAADATAIGPSRTLMAFLLPWKGGGTCQSKGWHCESHRVKKGTSQKTHIPVKDGQ